MSDLASKVIIVTGAAQGIGECIAENLTADGATLVLADIQAAKVAEVAKRLDPEGARVIATSVDIANPDSARKMVRTGLDAFGRIDALVNNASIDAPPGAAHEIDEAHWRQLIDVNLSGAWWCIRAVLPHMMERRSGKIVTISSASARFATPGVSAAYHAAKAGLIGLTIALSSELERHRILVNAITPGATGNTGSPISDGERAIYQSMFPLGYGGPEPIAHAVRYLLTKSGDWISGAVLNVSGGLLRGL